MNINDMFGSESWEGDYELYEKEDWVGLLNLRKKDAKKNASDLYAQQRYAEALNLNKRYKDTLDFITPLYNANHEVGFGIYEIIDALYGLGKTEADYAWIEKPNILKLDSSLIKLCIELLEPLSESISVTDIYCDLIPKCDYCSFNEQELGDYLVDFTDVFDVQIDNDFVMDSELTLIRK